MKTLAIAIMLLLAVVSHQQMKVEKPGTVCTKPAQKPSPSLGQISKPQPKPRPAIDRLPQGPVFMGIHTPITNQNVPYDQLGRPYSYVATNSGNDYYVSPSGQRLYIRPFQSYPAPYYGQYYMPPNGSPYYRPNGPHLRPPTAQKPKPVKPIVQKLPAPIDGPAVQPIKKESWPELLNKSGKEAQQAILKDRPELNVSIIPENSPVTLDLRTDRVRIFVNQSGKVTQVPTVG